MKNRFPLVFSWGPPILYAGLIFWLSSIPAILSLPRQSDKVIHFFEYFVFAILIWRALGAGHIRFYAGKYAVMTLCIGALYAASDEIHQLFVPGRTASIYDWLADVAGILGMLTLMIVKVK